MEQSKKILIVDDDKIFASAVEEYFVEVEKYDVRTINEGLRLIYKDL